jgi:hypothetical protein
LRRSDLEPSAAVDRAADARRARQIQGARGGAGRPPSRPSPTGRVVIGVNASYLTASHTFDDTRTFDLFAEQGRFTTRYDVQARVGVDAGGYVRLWRNLGAGVAFTTSKDDRDLAIDGSIPHPLLFSRNRAVEGTAAGTREERAVHIQAAYLLPVGKKMEVIVFGGPSFFTVKQSVVTGINYSDAYPYDEASFTSADVASEEEKKTGFNLGFDVGYYFTKNLGVGGIVRFSQTKVTFSRGEVDAGGVTVGGGVRLRF